MRTIVITAFLKGQLPPNFLLIILPLVLIDIGLILFSMVDLLKPERRVAGGNKLVWALVILLVGTAGPIAYLLVGRRQD